MLEREIAQLGVTVPGSCPHESSLSEMVLVVWGGWQVQVDGQPCRDGEGVQDRSHREAVTI